MHTIEKCRVRDIQKVDNNIAPVHIRDEMQTGQAISFEAKFIVDASGRDTFLANKYKTKQKDKKHSSSAIFGHFDQATRLPGDKEGYISIFWFEHGWFWFIPLADGTTSVGAVCWPYYLHSRKKPLDDFLERNANNCVCGWKAERPGSCRGRGGRRSGGASRTFRAP